MSDSDLLRENAGPLLGAMLGPFSVIAAPTHALSTGWWTAALAGEAEAWRKLAARHWYGVYAWWRRAGLEPDGASAATPACFARWMAEAPGGGGPLREWMLAALATLAEQETLDSAAPFEIDAECAEATYATEPEGAPDAVFQRRWALTLLELAMAALRAEYEGRGQSALFEELTPFAGFAAEGGEQYETAGGRLGLTTGAVRKAVFDLRTRHRELLRAFVADTITELAEIDREMTALLIACDVPGAELPAALRAFKPDELLARAMQTVRMTSGGASHWTPPSDAEAARLFPQYELLGLLGRGGMGAVYRARQVALDRCVAIKLLPLEVSVDQEFADRFRREARAMAKLSHPHIIHVYEFGTTEEGHLFFVMEFIEGANLADLIHGAGLPPQQALELASQVCSALAYAHGKGIIHRDIKPANVMVSLEGTVKVADFGLARLAEAGAEQLGHTVTGVVMGTPEYMAPEQKRGMAVDQRADIYSVGVMIYEMLCGETPQGAFEPPSRRAECDPRIDPIVMKAMHRDPARRYQSTAEMRVDIAAALASTTAEAAPPAPEPRPAPEARKKSRLLLYAGFTGLLLVLAGGASLFRKPQPSAARAQNGSTPAAAIASAAPRWEPRPDSWAPVFTDAKWSSVVAGKCELADGWLHLRGYGIAEAQPSPDGAVRARLKYASQEAPGAHTGGLELRSLPFDPAYSLFLYYNHISLMAHGRKEPLGGYVLQRALQPGDTIRLELQAVGDHIVALADDMPVIDVHDSQFTRAGRWGISAADAWFQDVQAQAFPAAQGEKAVSSGSRASTPASAKAGTVFTFGGHRYQFLEGPFLKDEAAEKAKSLGGHLVTITSAAEQAWIEATFAKLIGGGKNHLCRTGGRKAATDSPVWTNNEPWSYTNWDTGYPKKIETEVLVFLFQNGDKCPWRNRYWSMESSAIVEWDDDGTAQPATPAPAASDPSALATQETPFVNTLGMRFVPVPITGGPTAGQRVLFSIWHTRRQDYEAFVAETGNPWMARFSGAGPTHPAVTTSWEGARLFCEWLTTRERAQGRLGPDWRYRLPSDHEWSCAAGIGEREKADASPSVKSGVINGFEWGSQWPPPPMAGNFASEESRAPLVEDRLKWIKEIVPGYRDGYAETSPVGSYAANRFGLFDMAGNASQWCEDWFEQGGGDRVSRGSGFGTGSSINLLVSHRGHGPPEGRFGNTGFRCVLAPE